MLDDNAVARRRRVRSSRLACDTRGKRVAEPVNGSDEVAAPRIVTERVSHLQHESGEVRLGDENAGPDEIVQLLFRDRAWRLFREDGQDLKRFWRQVQNVVVAEQPSLIEINRVAIEFEAQTFTCFRLLRQT